MNRSDNQAWLDAKINTPEFQQFLGAGSLEQATPRLKEMLERETPAQIKEKFLRHSCAVMGLPPEAWRHV